MVFSFLSDNIKSAGSFIVMDVTYRYQEDQFPSKGNDNL